MFVLPAPGSSYATAIQAVALVVVSRVAVCCAYILISPATSGGNGGGLSLVTLGCTDRWLPISQYLGDLALAFVAAALALGMPLFASEGARIGFRVILIQRLLSTGWHLAGPAASGRIISQFGAPALIAVLLVRTLSACIAMSERCTMYLHGAADSGLLPTLPVPFRSPSSIALTALQLHGGFRPVSRSSRGQMAAPQAVQFF